MDEIKFLETFFHTKIYGTASHGDLTGFNNLDFWKNAKAAEFGLLYEAYDPALFDHCFYLSDSQYTKWKAYKNGKLVENETRCPCQHLNDRHPLVHLLIHPCTYYDRHFHEKG